MEPGARALLHANQPSLRLPAALPPSSRSLLRASSSRLRRSLLSSGPAAARSPLPAPRLSRASCPPLASLTRVGRRSAARMGRRGPTFAVHACREERTPEAQDGIKSQKKQRQTQANLSPTTQPPRHTHHSGSPARVEPSSPYRLPTAMRAAAPGSPELLARSSPPKAAGCDPCTPALGPVHDGALISQRGPSD